jgi:hypothetical protein
MGVIWSTLSGRFEDVETVYCLYPYVPEIALYPQASLEETLLSCIEFSQTKGTSIESRNQL